MAGLLRLCVVLLLQIFTVISYAESLEEVSLPQYVEFGKLSNDDDQVIGYTFMIDRRVPCTANWTRVVPNPARDGTFTYQPLNGSEPGLNVTSEIHEQSDTITTTLKLDNPVNQSEYSLRLTVDTSRGPVNIYLFPHNDDLYKVPLPKLFLPQSANYYIPHNKSQTTNAGVNITRQIKLTIAKKSDTPTFEINQSFVRVFQTFSPATELWIKNRWMYEEKRNSLLIPPIYPHKDQYYYTNTTDESDDEVVLLQNFQAQNAFRNDSGLYQFDTVVRTDKGKVYRISAPFLLRERTYKYAFISVLPCSPYRHDIETSFHQRIGQTVWETPCVKYAILGQRDDGANIYFTLLGADWPEQKELPAASSWKPKGFDDYKEFHYLVYPPDSDRFANKSRRSMAASSMSKHQIHRQESFSFSKYTPIKVLNKPKEVNDTTITFHCAAIGGPNLKVKTVLMKPNYLKILEEADRNFIERLDLKDLKAVYQDRYKGIASSKQSDITVDGENGRIHTLVFSKDKMMQIFRYGYIGVCLTYHEFDLYTSKLNFSISDFE